MTARVSIALLTRNGRPHLDRLLPLLRSRRSGHEVEVVAVDSGSTDGGRELLAQHADQLLDLDPADFDHGATRNLAVRSCRGEFVVLLVQDALPCSEDWLEALVRPLVDEPTVAGAFARQIPRPDASAVIRHNLANWVAGRREPRVVTVADAATWAAMSAVEKLEASAFDNVCSCLRRSVWETIPFRPAAIAEDLEWSRNVLLAGHAIAFAPAAEVVHSHDRSLGYELTRTRLVHHRLHELFGLRTIPTARSLVRSIVVTARHHVAVGLTEPGARSPRALARALGLAVVWPLGQYLGGRDAARGIQAARSRGV